MNRVQKCLDEHVEAGKISRAVAEQLLADIKRREAEHAASMAPGARPPFIAAEAAEALRAAAEKKRQQTALQILAADRIARQIEAHPKGPGAGTAAIFARDLWGQAQHGDNVWIRQRTVLGELHAIFADGLEAFRRKNLGLSQDTAGLRAMVRELYGEPTGDDIAANAAKQFARAADHAVDRFNAAGGNIKAKKEWRLPQVFDRATVAAASEAEFVEWMMAAWKRGDLRLHDFEAGGAAGGAQVNPVKANAILTNAYHAIVSDGLSDLDPGQLGKRALANSYNERRAFEWGSADAWLKANDQWGLGDRGIHQLITGHLNGLAHDIGLIEILGPNPDRMARILIDQARKDGAGALPSWQLEAIYDHARGTAATPVSETLARAGGNIRSWNAAAGLGSAMISAVTDFAALGMTAHWNGLGMAKVMARYVKLLNPANEADRKLAVRLNLIAEGWIDRAAGTTRDQLDSVVNSLPGRAADFVLRLSGLSAHTQAGRWAFGMELLAHLADEAGKKFPQLDRRTARALSNYGIDEPTWEILRAKGVADLDGSRFMDPAKLKIEAQGAGEKAAADRLMALVLTETDFAIPQPGARERALLAGKTRAGTWGGELLRAMAQYKSFPVTVMTTHGMRALGEIREGRFGYAVGAVVSMTMLGALAIQLKQVIAGKDPRDPWDARFWGAAFFQGGGAGILGDYINGALNRADQSFVMNQLGPTFSLVDDFARLTGANITAASEGRDTHFGRELARFIRRNTPGSTLWFTRAATDRMLFDQLQRALDADAATAFRRVQARVAKDTGQEFFWAPGQALPDRAPRITDRP